MSSHLNGDLDDLGGKAVGGPPTDPDPHLPGKRWGIGEVSQVTSWPIGKPPWLWATRIRILIVMDGRIRATSDPEAFGLGLAIDTLRDITFPTWWVRFAVTLAHRDSPLTKEDLGLGEPETPEDFSQQFDFTGFRFTQPGFDIDDYDQVWLFGDWPGVEANVSSVGDELISNNPQWAMDDEELLVLARWMDRGGGVFATGDHAMLGASMCHRVPRVRSMRRWTRSQGVPSFSDSDRNETLVHVSGAIDNEQDRWPQRIFPELRPAAQGPFFYGTAPHPVLCGRTGVIDHLPDHMHEGGLFEDDEVRLDDPLDIAGYDRPEYPRFEPVVAAAALATGVGASPEVYGVRPRPHVIAHGLTTNASSPPRVFPMIAVYDGDSVGLGRVVVDSTWHHWFSYNLIGLRDLSPGLYSSIQDYYRNVGIWLATPDQRASMLFAATWGSIVGSPPGVFDPVLGIRGVGERVVDVIGRSAPQCIIDELVATVSALPASTPREDAGDPSWLWAASGRNLTSAVVGSVALPMIRLAHDLVDEQTRGRHHEVDLGAIHELGHAGVASARQEIRRGLIQGSEDFLVHARTLGDDESASTSS